MNNQKQKQKKKNYLYIYILCGCNFTYNFAFIHSSTLIKTIIFLQFKKSQFLFSKKGLLHFLEIIF